MHRFFFATKDAFINSGSNSITAEDYTDNDSTYGFQYGFDNAEENGIIRPSITPSVFELKNLNRDIYGKVI